MLDKIQILIKIIVGMFSKDETPLSTASKTATCSIPEAQSNVTQLNNAVTIDDVHKAELAPPPKPRFVLPAEGRVTSGFGMRTIPGVLGGKPHFHNGIDFTCWQKFGVPIKCPEDGTVIMNKKDPTYPEGVTFVAIKGKYSGGYHYLLHMGSKDNKVSPLVVVGQQVKAGDVLGYSNSTGPTTGPHSHWSYYTPKWVCVDVVRCWMKRFAPELLPQISYYVDKGEKEPGNKTGNCCGEWGN